MSPNSKPISLPLLSKRRWFSITLPSLHNSVKTYFSSKTMSDSRRDALFMRNILSRRVEHPSSTKPSQNKNKKKSKDIEFEPNLHQEEHNDLIDLDNPFFFDLAHEKTCEENENRTSTHPKSTAYLKTTTKGKCFDFHENFDFVPREDVDDLYLLPEEGFRDPTFGPRLNVPLKQTSSNRSYNSKATFVPCGGMAESSQESTHTTRSSRFTPFIQSIRQLSDQHEMGVLQSKE